MKKFGKLAVLAAMILALACFVSCKNDDGDDDSDGNVIATYVCAEPQAMEENYTLTLKFYNDGKFSVTYKGNTTGEVSKGSYTGDPTKDGNIVFKVEDHIDIGYLAIKKEFKWEGKTIADQNITITNGKGEFNIWSYGKEEFTRQ